ncbi:b04993fb-395a-486f-9100-496a31d16c3a [Thermothielavioides terrestris]|uniref:B04993fb-395a-486f-9100-496a31d16c3a n=1 Tax=Thermothielavioides terrestris TaxID=2587410 RepID=A0A3S4B5G4_9PEZI|nr:b04993fb-395a-486f-9100-496a31d16c3a [Thermothielavioides terrestris]
MVPVLRRRSSERYCLAC